jgi:NADH-quinone oxidoreductase subunit F
VLRRIESGVAADADIDLAKDIGGNMLFKAFCALADGAVSPVDSSIKFFRDEYEEHIRLGRCPFVPAPGGDGSQAPLPPEGSGVPSTVGTRVGGRDVDLDEVLG